MTKREKKRLGVLKRIERNNGKSKSKGLAAMSKGMNGKPIRTLLTISEADNDIRRKLDGTAKTYPLYLTTFYWKRLRSRILFERGSMCEKCRSQNNLQVHHLAYSRNGKSILFFEKDSDLMVLCKDCHQKEHSL